ncbi:hypothetical protein D9M73_122410 [compost metagenome]
MALDDRQLANGEEVPGGAQGQHLTIAVADYHLHLPGLQRRDPADARQLGDGLDVLQGQLVRRQAGERRHAPRGFLAARENDQDVAPEQRELVQDEGPRARAETGEQIDRHHPDSDGQQQHQTARAMPTQGAEPEGQGIGGAHQASACCDAALWIRPSRMCNWRCARAPRLAS